MYGLQGVERGEGGFLTEKRRKELFGRGREKIMNS